MTKWNTKVWNYIMNNQRSTPPLHWLKAFEVSARTLSFTHAAEELLITQSAVSKQVKNLEYYLNANLFLRERGGLRLSEAGKNYLPSVKRGFANLEQGTRSFLSHSENVDLTIKSNYAFASFWLCQNIGEFMDIYPMVRCTISPALWEQDFSDSRADIEIHYGEKETFGPMTLQLTEEQLVPVCTPKIFSRIRGPEDLANECILDLTGIGDNWDYWSTQMNLTNLVFRNRHFFGTFVLALNMALEGRGITLAHSTLVKSIVDRGDLVMLPNMSVPSRDNYFALQNSYSPASEASGQFLEWLQQKFIN
jgi:LysR family glycine cleavage system transcriptional activator